MQRNSNPGDASGSGGNEGEGSKDANEKDKPRRPTHWWTCSKRKQPTFPN